MNGADGADRADGDLGAIDRELLAAVDTAQANGWRLDDLVHVEGRRDAQWASLLQSLDLGLERWRVAAGLTADVAGKIARRLAWSLARLPALPPTDAAPDHGIDDSVLAKVRALLAKAESTTFEPEAEALMAKAHELMTRYAIDQAVLAGAAPGAVTTRRIHLDEPYSYQRFVLLSNVAEAFGCRVLSWSKLGIAVVFGSAADTEATEVLYTSLLLQATTAMVHAPMEGDGLVGLRRGRRPAASTVAAFRRAFLVGFAARVGTRLEESRRTTVDAAVVAVAESGTDLLPVLADQQAKVDDAYAEFTKGMRRARPRTVSHAEGFVAGDRAGARASLAGRGDLGTRPAVGRG